MSSEENKTRTGVTPRPYDEACKRAAVAPWVGGVPASRVAVGLGITTESLRTWRRQPGGVDAKPGTDRGGKAAGRRAERPGVAGGSAAVARAQLQSVTHQHDILKEAVGIFAGPNRSVSP